MKPFDANGEFRAPSLGSGLRVVAIRGAGIGLFAEGSTYLIQLAGVTVLARLLAPSDFGLVAAVTTFSLFLASITQNGFMEAILQREEINHRLASFVFWMNLGIALILMLGFAACGPLISRFYHDPRVPAVAAVASLSILFASASVVHVSLLARGMRFASVSMNTLVARLVSVILSVVLALYGWGYWALVAGVIAQPLSILIGSWSLCNWMPGAPRVTEGTASLYSFAVHVNVVQNLNYWTRNTDNLLVGWRFGPAALGFYKKAYDLFVLPANQLFSVFPVAVSTLSRLAANPEDYRRYFRNGLSALALAGMGAAGVLTLTGKDLVRVILGPRWDSAGLLFTYFAPGIGVLLIYKATGMIHLSLGTTRRLLRWSLVELVSTVLLFVLALRWGAAGIAIAWTVSYWILVVPAFWYAGKPIQMDVASIIRTTGTYAGASLLAGALSALFMRQFPYLIQLPNWHGALLRIIATSAAFAVLYAGSISLLHWSFDPLKRFTGGLREMLPASKAEARL